MPKIATLNSVYPTDCATLLSIRQQYADRSYSICRGYIYYHLGKKIARFEHRMVAQAVHGTIPDGYHVHHINRVRTDNRVTNLRVLSESEHKRLHWTSGETLLCPICKREFWATRTRIQRAETNYCSSLCANSIKRVTERPSKDDLFNLLSVTPNFIAIGRMYGVSDNAVRKWCKQYELPHKTADWKVTRAGFEPATQNLRDSCSAS